MSSDDMTTEDMTTDGRSPHMPGGVDPEQLADDGSRQRADRPREDLEERDPLMGEAPLTDSTSGSAGVEPPD